MKLDDNKFLRARKFAFSYIDMSPRQNRVLKMMTDYENMPLSNPEDEDEIPEQVLRAEKKWLRHTKQARDKWIKSLKEAGSRGEFAKGIADFLDVPPEKVKGSLGAKSYKKFAEHPEKYVDEYIEGIKQAVKSHSWYKGYKEAFTTSAE